MKGYSLGGLPRHRPVIVGILITLSITGCSSPPTPSPRPSSNSPYLLTADGSLVYKGQAVTLRGENFNNEPGLACCGGPDIGHINASQADYQKIAEMGANHIRFGLDYQWYTNARAVFYSVIDQHLSWAAQAHLWVIPVMYIPPGGSSGRFSGQDGFWGSAANQAALVSFWADFAAHYATNPTVAGYDVFNEPAPPNFGQWSQFAGQAYDAITKADRNHLVVLEAALTNNLPAVSGDRILWSSHCFARIGTNGCNYPGDNPEKPPKLPFWMGEVGSRFPTPDSIEYDLQSLNQAQISWSHFVMHEPGYGLYQNTGAGDFSAPWQEMIQRVSAAMKGSVKPNNTP